MYKQSVRSAVARELFFLTRWLWSVASFGDFPSDVRILARGLGSVLLSTNATILYFVCDCVAFVSCRVLLAPPVKRKQRRHVREVTCRLRCHPCVGCCFSLKHIYMAACFLTICEAALVLRIALRLSSHGTQYFNTYTTSCSSESIIRWQTFDTRSALFLVSVASCCALP